MAFKKVHDYKVSDSVRIFTQNNFKSGIQYGSVGFGSGRALQFMENFILKDGIPVSSPGVRRAEQTKRGVCKASSVFNGRLFMQLGVSLYSWAYLGEEKPKNHGRISEAPVTMFPFGGKLYILSPEGYFSYETELSEVEPYVPVVAVDRSADGSTTSVYESFNMIGGGFEVWFNFSGDGTYKLPLKGLKEEFSVTLSGSDIKDKCVFDADEGTVTVSGFTAESEGINNLRVKAFRKDEDVAESRSKILGCKYFAAFGGTDGLGTRLFLAGNESCPNICFRSGLLDPTYFPDTEYEIIGHSGDRITGLLKQYNELIVFCENSIHAQSYVYTDSNVIFSRRTVNSSIGCDIPESIRLIDNNAVFCSSKKGVFMLSSAVSENENNVIPISANVNEGSSGLIVQIRLSGKKVFSIDYGGKYYLFVAGKAYVWDYSEVPYITEFGTVKAQRKLCWYMLNGLNVNFPVEFYGYVFFFSDQGQIDVYGDTDSNYGAESFRTLTTAPSGLGLPRIEKKLQSVTLSYRCKNSVDINIYFYCDGKAGDDYSFSARIRHDDPLMGSFHCTAFPVSLPSAHSFNIKLEVSGGSFELNSIDYEYTV